MDRFPATFPIFSATLFLLHFPKSLNAVDAAIDQYYWDIYSPDKFVDIRWAYLESIGNVFMPWKKNLAYFPFINLESYLTPVAHDNSLVIIDNHANINLPSTARPILIRNPRAFILAKRLLKPTGEWNSGPVDYQFIWLLQIPDHLINSSVSPNQIISNCSSSKYFNGGNISTAFDFCVRIRKRDFSTSTRPWVRHLHLHLYPAWFKDMENLQLLPELFSTTESPQKVTPSVASSIHIAVLNLPTTKSEERKRKSFVKGAAQQILNIHKPTSGIHHNAFLIFTVDSRISPQSSVPGDQLVGNILNSMYQEGNISKIELLQYCPLCPGKRIDDFLFVPLEKSRLPDYKSLTEKLFVPPDEMLVWVIKKSTTNNGLLSGNILDRLVSCEDWPSLFLGAILGRSESMERSKEDLATDLFSTIWLSIISNYSMTSKSQDICRNGEKPRAKVKQIGFNHDVGVTLEIVDFLKDLLFSSHAIQDKVIISNLRFVSCGTRGMRLSQLPFEQLTNAFDFYTWLIIMATMLALLLPLSSLSSEIRSANAAYQFVALVKVLLEQGDPFRADMLTPSKFRMLIGIILLMGVVISNAYKNTNIYQMIIPRSPIRLETFEQLNYYNFTIFSRFATTRKLSYPNYWMGFVKCKEGVVLRSPEEKTDIYCVQSEIHRATETINIFVKEHISNVTLAEKFNRKFAVTFRVRNKISLHPISKKKLSTMGDEVSEDGTIQLAKSELLHADYHFLRESLGECENVAAILPHYLCSLLARKIAKRNYDAVSVGKEVYSEFYFLFALSGPVPPYVIRRFKGVGTAGIWEFLMKLATGNTESLGPEDYATSQPTAATLRGNVVILFVLWSFGIMIAILDFLIEVRQVILKEALSALGSLHNCSRQVLKICRLTNLRLKLRLTRYRHCEIMSDTKSRLKYKTKANCE